MADQQFCLRWNNHQNTLVSVFDSLLKGGILVDCTLAAEGKFLRAHKVVLSACSPFFSDLLRQHYEQHPILIMKDVTFDQLKAMLDYMYRGEVNISQDQLGTFLKAAESLLIKGLSDNTPSQDAQSKSKSLNEARTSRSNKRDDDSTASRSSDTSPTPSRKKRRTGSGSGEDNAVEENSHENLLEASTPIPLKISVNSRLSNPHSPPLAPRDENSIPMEDNMRPSQSRELSISNAITFSKSDSLHHQPPSLVDSMLCEPKSEFIELDDEESMAHEEDASEAGPSHAKTDAGFSWHMERPEEAYLSQESLGQRNAQGPSMQHARFKLAHALKDLTASLHKPVAAEGSFVMEELAGRIGIAVSKLHGPTRRVGVNGKRPGPKSQTSRARMLANVKLSSFLDLDEENKIWQQPHIKLIDIIHGQTIKKECVTAS